MLYNQNIPEYEKYMYLKGYTPTQILQANRQMIYDKYFNDDEEIKIRLEIKK